MVKKRFPYLLGHAEIAWLHGVERQTSQLWKTGGVLGDPDVWSSVVLHGNEGAVVESRPVQHA